MSSAAERREPRVVVTGLGAVSVWGWGREALWNGLTSGETAISEPRNFDISGHRTTVAAEVPEPPAGVADQIALHGQLSAADRFAIAAGLEAVEQAGIRGSGPRVGVFFGGSTAGMAEGERWFAGLRRGRERTVRALESHPLNSPGDALARRLGVAGPVRSISSACASGGLAIGSGLDALQADEVDVAVVGGADSLCQLTYAGFNSLRAVDSRPCRPFRSDREGLSLGEGAGVLVLEREDDALARGANPLAVLRGAGATCDAHHMTAPEPEGSGAARAMQRALLEANCAAEEVAWFNAHGTGTPLNDVSEWHALARVFGERASSIPIMATKASVGHLLGSSGAIEAVASVLSLRACMIPPTPGDGELDPETPVDLVLAGARALPEETVVMSTSFAFGGSNSALLFSNWRAEAVS